MAAPAAYRVEGARAVRAALNRAGGRELLDALKAEHTYIAQLVARKATATAPRKSGRLANSIKGTGARGNSTVKAGTAARIPYGPVQHWGSRNRSTPPMNIRGRPWISEAAQSTEAQWAAHYEAALRGLMRRIQNGG